MTSKGPIRRSQLIAPFGVGAMVIVRDGLSLIACGLDHWYKRESRLGVVQIGEFKIEEWRLQQELGVSHFRLPPDFRRQFRGGQPILNDDLKIPFLRFPHWHFCPGCHLLTKVSATVSVRSQKCPECELKKKNRFLVQVPFVAMCEGGHIQDFPWREWAHRSREPSCNLPLRLKSNGDASLAGQEVSCDCGSKRTLSGITEGSRGETYLSANLESSSGADFPCNGAMPWLGEDVKVGCGHPLKGSLRSAANVYYAKVKSSIYLPRGDSESISEIISIFEKPPVASLVSFVKTFGGSQLNVDKVRDMFSEHFQPFSDRDIQMALKVIFDGEMLNTDNRSFVGDDAGTAFKRSEFEVLRQEKDDEQLLIRREKIENFENWFQNIFRSISLVHKLRETRALTGFTRIFSENQLSPEQLRAQLWRKPLKKEESWLPAYIVYGEGIFLEFDEKRLQEWENRDSVKERLRALIENVAMTRNANQLQPRELTPRFILLHTFAHILINRLVFECGYSSASLRERIFSSTNENGKMAGVLIYTAAGDSEGTMGGLVRLGKAGNLESVIRRALDDAEWCSADPVCMELGGAQGQGPDSCNLAACHSCALIPETACEEFNRFLDRATLVGSEEDQSIGYFNDIE